MKTKSQAEEMCIFPGKSNFMDAISFVMGEKTNCLRVKRLSELIHGAAIGRPVSNRCFVTAKFELPDGTKIDFQRSVIGSSADYKINGKVRQIHEHCVLCFRWRERA